MKVQDSYLCPSTVQRETAHRSGLNLASWGMQSATCDQKKEVSRNKGYIKQKKNILVEVLLFPFLSSYQAPGKITAFLIKCIDVGGESLEIRDDKLFPEGLGQENNVALDTPEETRVDRAEECIPTSGLLSIYGGNESMYFCLCNFFLPSNYTPRLICYLNQT